MSDELLADLPESLLCLDKTENLAANKCATVTLSACKTGHTTEKSVEDSFTSTALLQSLLEPRFLLHNAPHFRPTTPETASDDALLDLHSAVTIEASSDLCFIELNDAQAARIQQEHLYFASASQSQCQLNMRQFVSQEDGNISLSVNKFCEQEPTMNRSRTPISFSHNMSSAIDIFRKKSIISCPPYFPATRFSHLPFLSQQLQNNCSIYYSSIVHHQTLAASTAASRAASITSGIAERFTLPVSQRSKCKC